MQEVALQTAYSVKNAFDGGYWLAQLRDPDRFRDSTQAVPLARAVVVGCKE